MKFRLLEKTVETLEISTARKSPSVDVAGVGGDSIAFVMVVTGASTPGTASISLEGSLDDTSFVTIGSAVNVTANGVLSLSTDRPVFRHYRVSYAIASGSYTSTLKVLVKGDKE